MPCLRAIVYTGGVYPGFFLISVGWVLTVRPTITQPTSVSSNSWTCCVFFLMLHSYNFISDGISTSLRISMTRNCKGKSEFCFSIFRNAVGKSIFVLRWAFLTSAFTSVNLQPLGRVPRIFSIKFSSIDLSFSLDQLD